MDQHTYLQNRLPEILEFLHQMVAINSFTANSEGVNRLSELITRQFSNLGFVPEYVQSANPKFGRHLFLSNHPQDWQGPSIGMISHLDTVFPPEEERANDFSWRPEGDRIYGPGTDDIKGGTALIYMVLDALKEFHPEIYHRVRWLVCMDASEETLSDDFGKLCIERLPAPSTLAALVFEGGTPDPHNWPVVVARKGRAEFHVIAQGRGAHAGNHHDLGANAILQMAYTVQRIASLTDYSNKITFTPGVISGGSVVNRVPHQSDLKVEMRSFDPDLYEQGIQRMLALSRDSDVASQDGYRCSVRVDVTARNAPWPRNPGTDELFQRWIKAGQALDMRVIPEERGGLSDANLIWHHYPVLDGLGPCGDNAHCSERSPDGSKEPEYVLKSSFVPKALLNLHAILKLVDDSDK